MPPLGASSNDRLAVQRPGVDSLQMQLRHMMPATDKQPVSGWMAQRRHDSAACVAEQGLYTRNFAKTLPWCARHKDGARHTNNACAVWWPTPAQVQQSVQ